MILGRADERALSQMCTEELAAALDEALEPFGAIADEQRVNLLECLELSCAEPSNMATTSAT